MNEHSASGSTVFVVDDDASVCAHLRSFSNPLTSGCLVLDVRLPGMSGLKVQEELANAKNHLPIIFLTGHGGIAKAVRPMKAGAIALLIKPFRNQDLLDAVSTALQQDKARRAKGQSNSGLQESFKSLSARELDVVARVAAGALNKRFLLSWN